MEINKRSRSELKGYFQKNDIPTESNFAELIDGMLNQKDDGLSRPSGDPLSIEAERDDNGLKKLLNFYGSFSDPGASWSLCLNPREKPGDPSTGAAGLGIVDVDGKVRLFIDRKTGNVGIGTNKPAASLHVFGQSLYIQGGQILAPAQLVLQAGSPNTPGLFGLITHSVQPNGAFAPGERLSIDILGNVGIGAPKPAAPLDVLGKVRIGLDADGSGSRSISFDRDRGDEKNCGKISYKGFDTQALSIVGAGSPRAIKLWDDVEVARNTTVQGLLTAQNAKVQGDLEVVGNLTPSKGKDKNRGITFPKDIGGGGGDIAWIRYYARSGEDCTLEIGVDNDAQDSIALMPSGNVGIGTNDPKHKLHIVQSVADAGIRLDQAGGPRWFQIAYEGNGNIHFYHDNAKGQWMDPGNGDWHRNSDIRLKEDISEIPAALEKAMRLKPVQYRWKADGSSGLGFIAQEVEEVFPELVSSTTLSPDGAGAVKGLAYTSFGVIAIAALQELKAELERKVDSLERRVAELTDRSRAV